MIIKKIVYVFNVSAVNIIVPTRYGHSVKKSIGRELLAAKATLNSNSYKRSFLTPISFRNTFREPIELYLE